MKYETMVWWSAGPKMRTCGHCDCDMPPAGPDTRYVCV